MRLTRSPHNLFAAAAAVAAVGLALACTGTARAGYDLGDCLGGQWTPYDDYICDPTAECQPYDQCVFVHVIDMPNGVDGIWSRWEDFVDVGECQREKLEECWECTGGALVCAEGFMYKSLANCRADIGGVAAWYQAGPVPSHCM